MTFLLVAINASYSHTSLAVRSLSACTGIPFCEFTINQPVGEILRGIEKQKPDAVLFSTYIWNAEITAKIIPDVKKVLPESIVGAGGPEFSYRAAHYLQMLSELDFIMWGEGERVLKALVKESSEKEEFLFKLKDISGLFLRNNDGQEPGGRISCDSGQEPGGRISCDSIGGQTYIFTGEQELIWDLGELNFPYPMLEDGTAHKGWIDSHIFYYESSRGCPYSCSYCLSSVDKKVRFMPLERVYKDLQIFLDANVPLVKFVDRTYNLNPERYISIWQYILEHHNKKTMFHFEIEAEYLSKEALEFLQQVPADVMQFEIGVQSANKKTLQAINRSDNIEKLAENIKQIPRTIHQHLDLIAGLPFENLESFGKSFDFVMALKPDALQLGFLKVLSGTQMEKYAKENGWKWMKNPVYETFSTPYMPYEHMMFLKDLETLVDAYWNSGKFPHVMAYVERNIGFWKFFYDMTKWGQTLGIFDAPHRKTFYFELLARGDRPEWGVAGQLGKILCPAGEGGGRRVSGWSQGETSPLYDLLRYDFVLRGKQGGFPQWYTHRYNKDRHRELLNQNGGVKNARLDFAFSEYEAFDWNVDAEVPEVCPQLYEKLIFYKRF